MREARESMPASTYGGQVPEGAALIPFNFHGDALDVVRVEGDVALAVRRLCEALGLDPDAQLRRLDRLAAEGVRWAVTAIVAATGPDGKTYQVRALPRRSIPMWAATVDASRVAPEVRARLVAYQDEAAEVLAEAFLDQRRPARPIPAREQLRGLIATAAAEGDFALVEHLARAAQKARVGVREPAKPPVDLRGRVRAYLQAHPDGLPKKKLVLALRGNHSRSYRAIDEMLAADEVVYRDGRLVLATGGAS